MKTLEQKVIGIIADGLNLIEDAVSPTSSIADDLNADSMDLIEIAMDVENEFGIEILDSDLEKCQTVQDLITLVKTLVD